MMMHGYGEVESWESTEGFLAFPVILIPSLRSYNDHISMLLTPESLASCCPSPKTQRCTSSHCTTSPTSAFNPTLRSRVPSHRIVSSAQTQPGRRAGAFLKERPLPCQASFLVRGPDVTFTWPSWHRVRSQPRAMLVKP